MGHGPTPLLSTTSARLSSPRVCVRKYYRLMKFSRVYLNKDWFESAMTRCILIGIVGRLIFVHILKVENNIGIAAEDAVIQAECLLVHIHKCNFVCSNSQLPIMYFGFANFLIKIFVELLSNSVRIIKVQLLYVYL